MKKSTGIRMLLRSPVKTVVTLVLIAAASFLFLYNLLDYAMTKREYARTYAAYHGYFSIMRPEDREFAVQNVAQDGEWFLSDPAGNPAYSEEHYPYSGYHMETIPESELETVAAIPGVTKVERRYMTGGLAEFKRTYTYNGNTMYSFFLNTHRIVFEGTVADFDPENLTSISFLDMMGIGYDAVLKLKDVKVVAGDEDDLKQNRGYIDHKRLGVDLPVVYPDQVGKLLFGLGIYARVGLTAQHPITPEMAESLVPGERYLFIASVDPYQVNAAGISENEDNMYGLPYVYLGDDSLYGTCSCIIPLAEEPENYLETEKFAGVRRMMEIIETDKVTLDVHYAEEMQALRRYQEGKLLLMQGRLLTPEDTESRNPVCVIPESMAELNKLSLGDTLHLRLGDKILEQYAPFGAVAWSPLRYADNWTEQDFTIVGTYTELQLDRLSSEDQYWAYGENAVFVPLTFLPETADRDALGMKPVSVSFVIEDADSILPFREEALPQLEAMGWYVNFFDGGWPAVREQLGQAGSLSLVKLGAFAFSAVLVLWLTVYLYILRKKKEFAVMRALGCTRGKARGALLFPLLSLAVPAILLGALGAILYTRGAAERNAAEFAILGLSMDTSIPVPMVLAGFGGSLVLLLILAFLALARVSSRPPLELLQDGAEKPKQRRVRSAEPGSAPGEPDLEAILRLPAPTRKARPGAGFGIRYVRRKLQRTSVKALLCLLLAFVLCFSIGYFALLRSTYRDLYQNVEVKARFTTGFSNTKGREVEKSGYARDPYYVYTKEDCESDFVYDKLILTNDLSRVCSAAVTWREDKGPEIFTQTQGFCVITRDLADALGTEIGKRIHFCGRNKLELVLADSHPEMSHDELVELYKQVNGSLLVVGIAETDGMTAYGPVAAWEHIPNLFSDYVPLDYAEFTLEDYHRATEFRSYAWRLIYGTRAEFSMDTGEADRIYQTYRLLELLFPIAFALALVLGAVLPAGVILQSAKEASLLRVLGTTKGRTRSILCLEQVFLCLLGLLLAVLGLLGLRGAALGQVKELLGLYLLAHFVLCILSTAAAAASVSRRRVLELLQVKE